MIKVESNKGATIVKISGDFPTLCSDTVCILRGIYDSIAEASESHGAMYEQAMRDCFIKLAFDIKEGNEEEKSEKAEEKEAPEKKEDDPLDGIMAIIKAIMEA